jgi:hypothetical protein
MASAPAVVDDPRASRIRSQVATPLERLPMASVEQIRRVLRGQPFRPFGLKMVDGTVHIVTHPDWLLIPPTNRPREVAYASTADPAADDYDVHWLDINLISEVIVPAPAAANPTTPDGK